VLWLIGMNSRVLGRPDRVALIRRAVAEGESGHLGPI
jgi:hypothetical protein